MLTIRQARESDREAMCAMQRAAILRHYSGSFGEQGARQFAEKVDAGALQDRIDAAMIIVAEEAGKLLGFAQFDSATGEIELSCNSDAEQRAIPAALLAVIETEARSRGLHLLKLYAMKETERLFAASGFSPAGASDSHGGTSLPSTRLEKRLVYTEPRPERRRNGGGNLAPTLT